MDFKIPESVKTEHEELHAQLAKATGLDGPVGDAARSLARALHEHFVKEEEVALPPLGLLLPLSQDLYSHDMDQATGLSDRLKEEYGQMIKEHGEIISEAKKFIEEAQKEGMSEYVQFGKDLLNHARMEEEIFYPAAILVGEYIRQKLAAIKS